MTVNLCQKAQKSKFKETLQLITEAEFVLDHHNNLTEVIRHLPTDAYSSTFISDIIYTVTLLQDLLLASFLEKQASEKCKQCMCKR